MSQVNFFCDQQTGRQMSYVSHFRLSPVHTREPIKPRSLPLWNGRIGNERALIGMRKASKQI